MNRRTVWSGAWLLLCFLLTGCFSSNITLRKAPYSALEIRAMQTRTYDAISTSAALKAAMQLLQDEGFQVQFGDSELGLLYARNNYAGYIRENGFFTGGLTSTLEATVTIVQSGKNSKIRVSFSQNAATGDSFFGSQGRIATPVLEPDFYQQFFAKLDQSIFLKKQGI